MTTPENELSSNRRVARNAFVMSFRMVIATLVGIYTSRVVLNALGVEDYGVSGVAGGLIGMVGFLNAAMAGATSRFITYEMGRGNYEKLNKVFSSALIIHLLISLFAILLAETVGLWFLENRLNFPPARLGAARWVYQLSVLTLVVGFTQTPYGACIVAHEHMHKFAYMELLNAVLKLLIVYLLAISPFDKLKTYAVLGLCVGLLIAMIYRVYCIRHFKECRFHWVWDKEILRPMLTFSGLDLYGNMCVTISQQSNTWLVNIFFGVVCNAAASIALTVNGMIMGFTTTVAQAFAPQITKNYAAGNIEQMGTLMRNSMLFTVSAISIMAVPCSLEGHYVLNLWLGQVPDHAVNFLRLGILAMAINTHVNVLNTAIHATGDIRRISFINGTLWLLLPCLTWCMYKLGWMVESSSVALSVVYITLVTSSFRIVHRQIPTLRILPLLGTIVHVWFTVAVCFVVPFVITRVMPESFLRLVIVIVAYAVCFALVAWHTLLNASNRQLVRSYALSKAARLKSMATAWRR